MGVDVRHLNKDYTCMYILCVFFTVGSNTSSDDMAILLQKDAGMSISLVELRFLTHNSSLVL